MGLFTLLVLAAFTVFYLSKTLEKKPQFVVQFVEQMTARIDDIAFWSAVYGVFATLLTLMMPFSSIGMLPRLLANVGIIVMTLPFTLSRISAKYEDKANPAILTEAKNWGAWVVRHEKYVGYAGAALTVLLFLVIFK